MNTTSLHPRADQAAPEQQITCASSPAWIPQRIGIIGAGAMGISLAAILAQRADVRLVCRNPDRAAKLIEQGAVVHGKLQASSRPRVIGNIQALARDGGVSAVFVATKTTAIDDVAAELRPLLATIGDHADSPFVVSFQNGIESGRCLMQKLKHPRVLRMVLNYGARQGSDGAVAITLSQPPHYIGSPGPGCAAACTALARLLTASGLATEAVPDIEPFVWFKGIVNAAAGPVASLVDASVADTLDSPAGMIVSRLLDEGLAVARAEGIDLGPHPRRRLDQMLERARPHTPSMVEDVRAGRLSEVGQLNQQIIRHALRAGVPVPTHEAIAALIDAFDWRVFRRTHADQKATGVPAA